jgi:CO/xanthine dehydrogenase FAD-binding subunit
MWNQYFTPNKLSEALQLMERFQDQARIIAGGTDLVLDLSNKRYSGVEALVDISSIPELRRISLENELVTIGSAVTLTEILRSDLLRSRAGVLVDAVRMIAGPQIRNIATIGGNVVNASPAADTIPPLLVLGSRVSIISSGHKFREMTLSEFLIGNRQVDIRAGEIVTAFHFPLPDPAARFYFRKVQPRRSMAIAMLNLAIMLKVKNDRITNVKIVMGAVAPTVVRVNTVESELKNLPVSLADDPKLYTGVNQDIAPISDFRATRIYRINVAQNLLREAVLNLVEMSK